MSDLISRQAAIDALVKAIREDPYYDSDGAGLSVCDVRVILNELPSAQPEIVRCKDCKYGDRSCKTCYYIDKYLGGVFFCRRVKESKRVKPDFYCKKWRGEPNGRSNQ